MRRYLSLLCQAAKHDSTQLHRLPSASLSPSVTKHSVCSPVSETKFFLWLEPAVEAMRLWKTFVSSKCVRITMTVANILHLSPSPEPTTLSFLRSVIELLANSHTLKERSDTDFLSPHFCTSASVHVFFFHLRPFRFFLI